MSNLHLSLQPFSASSSGAVVAPLKPRRMKRKPNLKPSLRAQTSSIYKSNNVSPCTECGKQFNTWKALFGHMRCHPERQWRGMSKKLKPRQKQQEKVHSTDEVTNAALILMQMSGCLPQEVSACIENCRERKTTNMCIDLNLPPPMEEN